MALYPRHPVLVVDDEETWLRSLSLALKSNGIDNILTCQDSSQVEAILRSTPIEVMVVDLAMPGVSGEEIIALTVERYPEIPVVVITGLGQVETAVACMRRGAFDFFVKTADKNSLVSGIRHAIQIRELKRENTTLRARFLQDTLERPEAFAAIVTCSKAMRSIFQYIEAIAPSTQPVLITGESGVGKELVARAIHTVSDRTGAFVAVNVAGLDDTVFADTLFGHKKGAFTGAEGSRLGLVEQARGGTLFLDEIGDLSPASQLKLLRLVQEREYLPMGSDVTRKTDARIIAATNAPLERLGEPGRFRADLYYRLRAHHIHLPPLRERREDIPLLVEHFLREGRRRGMRVPPEALRLLQGYSFPGNVRELRFLVLDALQCATADTLPLERIAAYIRGAQAADMGRPSLAFGAQLPSLKEACALLVEEALRRSGGNQTLAASMLGISRQAFNKRLLKMQRGVRGGHESGLEV